MDNEETARFTIVGRDRSGQPNFIYPNDSTLAICITKSINYAKGYLRHAGVQDYFLRYVMDHEQTVPNTWYKDAGYQDAPHVRDHFNSSIFPYFCLIVIDHTITNPDCLGRLMDREWDGLFNIRDHCIVLNALRVNDMILAYNLVHHSNQRSKYDDNNLDTFYFNFANTFFREICSLSTVPPSDSEILNVLASTNPGTIS